MYASTSGDEYARDNGGYPGGKPGTVYPGSFYMQGSNSLHIPFGDLVSCNYFVIILCRSVEDLWSSTGYSAMLGNSPHIGPPGSFSSLNPQDRMVGRPSFLRSIFHKIKLLLLSNAVTYTVNFWEMIVYALWEGGLIYAFPAYVHTELSTARQRS